MAETILKKIQLPNGENLQIATTEVKVNEQDNKILTLNTEHNELTDNANPIYTIGLNVDDKTIIKSENGLKTALRLEIVHGSGPRALALTNKDGVRVSHVNLSDIVGSSILKSSKYAKETGILTLTFNNEENTKENAIEVDLKELLDINDIYVNEDSKKYLEITTGDSETDENQIGIKILTYNNIDQATEEAEHNGLVDANTVKTYVESKIGELPKIEYKIEGTTLSLFGLTEKA